MLVFGKNKLTKFKDKIYMDLDPDTLTLVEISKQQAIKDADNSLNGMTVEAGKVFAEATDWSDDDE